MSRSKADILKSVATGDADVSDEELKGLASFALNRERAAILARAASGKKITHAERRMIQELSGGDAERGNLRFAENKSILAKEIPTSRVTLNAVLKRMGNDGLSEHHLDNGMWDVAKVRNYMRKHSIGGIAEREEVEEELSQKERLQAELLAYKVEDMRMDIQVRRGELLDMKTFEEQLLTSMGMMRYRMMSRWEALAEKLSDRTIADIKRRGKEDDVSLLLQFANGEWPKAIREKARKFMHWLELNEDEDEEA